jgi:hypothetical protein
MESFAPIPSDRNLEQDVSSEAMVIIERATAMAAKQTFNFLLQLLRFG